MLHGAGCMRRCVLHAPGNTQHATEAWNGMPACLHVAIYKGLVVAGCTVHVACACCTSRALRSPPLRVPCCALHDPCCLLRVACGMLAACCMLSLQVACGCRCILHVACFLLHGASSASLFRAACFTERVACCRFALVIRIGSCLLQYPLRTPAGVA
jgi:hypothetical protein